MPRLRNGDAAPPAVVGQRVRTERVQSGSRSGSQDHPGLHGPEVTGRPQSLPLHQRALGTDGDFMSVREQATIRAGSPDEAVVVPRPRSVRPTTSRPTAALIGAYNQAAALLADPRRMRPCTVRWAYTVTDALRLLSAAQVPDPGRTSLITLVWTLAAAADDEHVVPDHAIRHPHTVWLHQHGWLTCGACGACSSRQGWSSGSCGWLTWAEWLRSRARRRRWARRTTVWKQRVS
jgi:hypothetical protein